MAEYCAQCAVEFKTGNGFFNECKPEYLITVICEGCGIIQVNHKGECVSIDCGKNHAVYWQPPLKKRWQIWK